MYAKYQFNRQEISGALGDLGTVLPLSIGLIMICGLSASGLFLSVGLLYIIGGIYYGITVPVQPMKVVSAYAIATAMSAVQVTSAGLLMGLFLLFLGITGIITIIGKYIPKSVIRGVQVSGGVLLISSGVKFMIGTTKFQTMLKTAEPYLWLQTIGPIQVGIIFGVIGGALTLILLDNKKIPAGLAVVLGGLIMGLIFGTYEGFDKLKVSIYIPEILPFGAPTIADLTLALLMLVLPQIPMTVGNAVIANAELSKEYFGENAKRMTYRASCISMGIAGLGSFLL